MTLNRVENPFYVLRMCKFTICFLCIFGSRPCFAFDPEMFFINTYLLNVQHRTYFRDKVINLQNNGYELADGTGITFKRWYSPKFADMQIDFLTQITPDFGLIWGASSGDYGEKFVIQPSYRLGFVYQTQLSTRTNLSFSFTRQLRGRLQEKPCVADYGSIGGIQNVNCRYAARTLEPSQTLLYLLNEKPPDNVFLSVRFRFDF